jgi:DNA-binding winged helix-turn-helix (wHTH) protein/Tol biopolymer transport system component
MQVSILYFDQFELDLNSYELRKSGRVVKLEKLPMELLILLAEKRGQLVTREQIIQRLWGDDVFVDTRQGINTAIRKIRVVLRDDPEHPRLLQTVTGKGYRLMAPISSPDGRPVEEPALQLPVPSSSPLPPIPFASATNRVRRRSVLIAAIIGLSVASVSIWLLMRGAMSHRPAVEKRVTSNSSEAPVKWVVISRDGKYLAYTDPGGMYLRVLATGETRRWKLPPDFIANPNSWFPDGTHLLAMRLEGSMKTPSLWKLSLFGDSAQKLLDNAGPGWVSPGGSRIAFLRVPEFGHELWVMGSNGFNPHRIAVAGDAEGSGIRISQIFPVTWSPDGRRIAYIERELGPSPSPVEDALFSLRTCDASGGDLQVILKDARLRPALSWPEKDRIVFAYREDLASEHSDEGVRSMGVDPRSGKAAGRIERVTKGAGSIGGMSSTSDGNQLAFWRMNTQFEAYVAEFDAKTRRLNAPRRVTLDANGNVAEAWLPDSRTILFVSNRDGKWNLYKQAIDETTADLLAEGGSIFLPRLSADSSQILYESRADPQHFSAVSLLRLPLAGGPPKLVLQGEGILNYQCARLPSTLCLVSKQQGPEHVFSSFDLERGMGLEVLRISGGPYDWTLSPDGRTLAVFPGDHRIRFFSFENGAARETKTITINDWKIQQGDWSADGKVLLMESYTASGGSVILQVDRAGQALVLLKGEPNVEFWWILPSPDGRYGIIEARVPGDNNAWMLERF